MLQITLSVARYFAAADEILKFFTREWSIMSIPDWVEYAGMTVLVLLYMAFGKKYLRWFFFMLLGAMFAGMFYHHAFSDWFMSIFAIVVLVDILAGVVSRIVGRSFDEKMNAIMTAIDREDKIEADRQAWMRENPYS